MEETFFILREAALFKPAIIAMALKTEKETRERNPIRKGGESEEKREREREEKKRKNPEKLFKSKNSSQIFKNTSRRRIRSVNRTFLVNSVVTLER